MVVGSLTLDKEEEETLDIFGLNVSNQVSTLLELGLLLTAVMHLTAFYFQVSLMFFHPPVVVLY